MFIIYPNHQLDSKNKFGSPDPVKLYFRHYINGLVLSYIMKQSKVFDNRQRANIELEICERKQRYWTKILQDKIIIEIRKIAHQNFMSVLADYYEYL